MSILIPSFQNLMSKIKRQSRMATFGLGSSSALHSMTTCVLRKTRSRWPRSRSSPLPLFRPEERTFSVNGRLQLKIQLGDGLFCLRCLMWSPADCKAAFHQLNAVTLHSGFVTLGSGSAPPRWRYFRPCSQLRVIELRFRRPDLSLFGRVKIFSQGDYIPCSHP